MQSLPNWAAAARLLGLGLRARSVVIGVDGVRAAAMRGNLVLAVVASDISDNSGKKLYPLLRAKSVTLRAGPAAEQLGEVFGKRPIGVVGVTDRQLAEGILRAGDNTKQGE